MLDVRSVAAGTANAMGQPGFALVSAVDPVNHAVKVVTHCLLGWSYSGLADSDTVDLLTWGTIQKVTWGWLKSRVMEAHGLVWPQLTLANGLYPTGPDLDALRAQNAEFLNNDA